MIDLNKVNVSIYKEKRISYKSCNEAFEVKAPPSSQSIKEVIPPYIASAELNKAVQYAWLLKRPLLIRGEPGSGKTRLAQALAYKIYKNDYRSHYFEWYIKSTTKATEGLYRFDYLKRLQDAELKKLDDSNNETYRSFGPLGKAFLASEKNKPTVLLIDEIDKADIDFPNDLLLELDQKRFFIPETEEEILANESPIVIITSNDEKELPNAFLRRCVFYYINFPKEEALQDIIKAHQKSYAGNNPLNDEIVEEIVTKFYERYNDMKKNSNTEKRISTSELLDWVKLIYHYFIKGELDVTQDLISSDGKILYPEVLYKTLNDYKQFYEKK